MSKPNIRFRGYTEDWEQRKVSEITDFHKQGFYTTESYGDSKKYYLLRGTDLTENRLILKNTPKINATEKDYQAFKVQIGDCLIVRSGTVGTYGIVYEDISAIFGSYLIDFRFDKNQVTNEFFGYFYQSNLFKNQLNKIIQQSANTNINAENIKSTFIKLPSLYEQKRISEFFSNLDNLITLHQRKCEETRKLKKYMLQKMFPQKRKKIPEIRFKGFTEDWEQRKLSEISDVRDGTHDSPSYLSDGHPFVTSKNVKDGYINYDDVQYISDEDFEAINKRSKVDMNDILMGMIGTIGNLALIRTEPDFAIKNVALIKDTKQVSYMYLYHYLQSSSAERQLLSGLDGGTQKFVSLKNIRELNIMVPSEAEQLKVGNFIESLDHLITLHQQKYEELQKIKKFMLQNMFV